MATELDEIKGTVKSMQTSFAGMLSELKDANKHYEGNNVITENMFEALKQHCAEDKNFKTHVIDTLKDIDKMLRGNGVMGIKTKLSLIWYAIIISIPLLASGIAYLFYIHMAKGG